MDKIFIADDCLFIVNLFTEMRFNMKKILFCFLFVFTNLAYSTSAFQTGNDLYSKLNSNAIHENTYAWGYILGVADSRFSKCKLPNITGKQVVDSVKKFLDENPNQRQHTASSIVELVITKDYGCK